MSAEKGIQVKPGEWDKGTNITTCQKCGTFYKSNLHVHTVEECRDELFEIKRIREADHDALKLIAEGMEKALRGFVNYPNQKATVGTQTYDPGVESLAKYESWKKDAAWDKAKEG